MVGDLSLEREQEGIMTSPRNRRRFLGVHRKDSAKIVKTMYD